MAVNSNEFDDRQRVDSLVRRSAEGEVLQYVHFWKHHQAIPSAIDASCFSQWFRAPFVKEDESFVTAEHFMMVGKARLFGDGETAAEILADENPAHAQKFGRKVRNFEPQTWLRRRYDLVTEGNMLKFAQNPSLAAFIHSTGDAVLVEASPVDRIWGIGLAAGAPGADNPSQWNGLNLLGFALMDVRSALRG